MRLLVAAPSAVPPAGFSVERAPLYTAVLAFPTSATALLEPVDGRAYLWTLSIILILFVESHQYVERAHHTRRRMAREIKLQEATTASQVTSDQPYHASAVEVGGVS